MFVDEDDIALEDKLAHFWEFPFSVIRVVRGFMLHGLPHARLFAKSGMSTS
jgi:hypothetical protein